jgi:hypothetical protein
MIVVYIASPYTVGNQAENVRRQIDAADKLMGLGYCPEAPLLSHFQHLVHPRPYVDWMAIDIEKLRRSDVLIRLPGESVGADAEVREAERLGIPVVRSLDELYHLRESGAIR